VPGFVTSLVSSLMGPLIERKADTRAEALKAMQDLVIEALAREGERLGTPPVRLLVKPRGRGQRSGSQKRWPTFLARINANRWGWLGEAIPSRLPAQPPADAPCSG
jgi:hypothetical protein